MGVVEGVEELRISISRTQPPCIFIVCSHMPERMMRRASWPKAVRAVEKLLLVDGLQHHRHRSLKHLVLEGRNADGARLLTVALRDVYSSHGRCPVAVPDFARSSSVAEVFLQVRRVLFRGLPVHACGAVLARASVRLVEPVDIDGCASVVNGMSRISFASFAICWSFVEMVRARCLRHRSLQQPRRPVPPFPPRGPSGGSPASTVLRGTPTPRLLLASLRFPSPGATARACARRRDRASQVSGEPSCHMPCPWTPGDLHAGPLRTVLRASTSVLPSAAGTARLQRLCSFGALSHGLLHSLSTLRSQGRPLDHARLASGWGPALAGRRPIAVAWSHCGFQVFFHLLLTQAWPGAQIRPHYRAARHRWGDR